MKKKLPEDVDGKNGLRAHWVATAIAAYLGTGSRPGGIDAGVAAWKKCTKGDDEDVICDLLCDLHHWCDRNGVDFESRVIWEKAKELPEDTTVEFMRALRRWGKKTGNSYAEGLRKAAYHYKAETGSAPY